MARYTVSPHAQGTPEWLADRVGNLNGSEVDALYVVVKSGESAAKRDLRNKLVLEGITGRSEERDFKLNAAMQWGKDHEEENRQAFETATGLLVQESGYCKLVGRRAGCSPDGLVWDDAGRLGLVELKCPKSETHLNYLRTKEVPRDYFSQMRHNVWVTGAQFAVFQSFDPRMPEKMRVFRKILELADLDIDGHERMALQFLMEVERDEKAIKAEFGV